MIYPSLSEYVSQIPTPIVPFSGYYTRTKENWPLIDPLYSKLKSNGLYIVGALSGYGTMSACAAGELCAQYLSGDELPSYARNFHPVRYDDAVIVEQMSTLSSDGQ